MLIQSMTDEEVTNEILKDWYELMKPHGTISRLALEYDSTRRRTKINKTVSFNRSYPIKTNSKNTWIIFLSKAPSVNSYKGLDSINILSIVYYYTSIGIRAFKVIPNEDGKACNGLSIYNSHLFKRYKERLNLDIPNPIETIIHFFINNGYSSIDVKDIGGKKVTLGICKDGILLGEMQNQGKWVVHKTFINSSLMFPEQTLEEKKLLQNLQSEIEAELNSPHFDKNKYNYHTDTMLGITAKA